MFSPTLLSKIHELTNNSSVETFVIVGAQADSTLLMLVSVSTRFDSGLMFKELGSYATSDAQYVETVDDLDDIVQDKREGWRQTNSKARRRQRRYR